jgi:hypothetical protein
MLVELRDVVATRAAALAWAEKVAAAIVSCCVGSSNERGPDRRHRRPQACEVRRGTCGVKQPPQAPATRPLEPGLVAEPPAAAVGAPLPKWRPHPP